MDNYNNQYGDGKQYQPGYGQVYNQGQQYQPGYGQGYNQGQQFQPNYGYNMQSDGTYNTYSTYPNMTNSQSQIANPYAQDMSGTAKKNGALRILTLSFVLGIMGSIIMFIGLMMPAIDFSHFHSEVDIQYNLFKVGKNVGLISAMWNVIPYAIMISIIVMAILAFVRIPILKLLPAILILCMLVLMLIDMGNVATWAADMLDTVGIVLEKEITAGEIMKSLMPGIYILVAGWLVSLVSCFVKIKD